MESVASRWVGDAETQESGLTVGLRRRHCSGRICRDLLQKGRTDDHHTASPGYLYVVSRSIPKPEPCQGNENLKTEHPRARHYS